MASLSTQSAGEFKMPAYRLLMDVVNDADADYCAYHCENSLKELVGEWRGKDMDGLRLLKSVDYSLVIEVGEVEWRVRKHNWEYYSSIVRKALLDGPGVYNHVEFSYDTGGIPVFTLSPWSEELAVAVDRVVEWSDTRTYIAGDPDTKYFSYPFRDPYVSPKDVPASKDNQVSKLHCIVWQVANVLSHPSCMKFAEKQLHTKLYRSNFSAEGFADVINAGYHCEPSPIYEDVKAIALAHYKELWNNDGFQMAIEARTLPGRFMRDYMSKIGGRWLDTKNEGLLAVEDSRDTEAERKGTKRKDLP